MADIICIGFVAIPLGKGVYVFAAVAEFYAAVLVRPPLWEMNIVTSVYRHHTA